MRNAPDRPEDAAGRALARRLAQLLDEARGTPDEAKVFNDLAPKYLAALLAWVGEALDGLPPASRAVHGPKLVQAAAAVLRLKPAAPVRLAPVGKLDELRARAARRAVG